MLEHLLDIISKDLYKYASFSPSANHAFPLNFKSAACLQGTAMASLVHMQRILANRQLHFPSVEKAVRC